MCCTVLYRADGEPGGSDENELKRQDGGCVVLLQCIAGYNNQCSGAAVLAEKDIWDAICDAMRRRRNGVSWFLSLPNRGRE